jgi:hypothetical protein
VLVLDRDHAFDFGNLAAQFRLNAKREGRRRHWAAPAGAVHLQVDKPLFIELHQLDVATVGVQRGPYVVENILDLRENLGRHGLPFADE